MSSNTTAIQVNDIAGFSITFTVSFISIIISTFICLMIIIITFITPNLRSPKNLLLCNTCLCTLFYSIISIINTIYFLEPTSTDWSCRIRGYLNYVALSLVIYSYVIQAISRLFWTVFYRYRYLLSIKCHVYLIVTQICLSFLIELSTIITKDITFHPLKICFVPMNYKIHVMYLLTIGYIVPISTVIILYTIIYRHTIRSTSNVQRSSSRTKRDAELARNILILLSIFVFSGIPTVIYVIVSSTTEFVPIILFLIAITTPPIAVAIEKIVTLILNKDIRNALKQRWIACCPNCLSPSNSVQPFTRTTNTNPTLKKWF